MWINLNFNWEFSSKYGHERQTADKKLVQSNFWSSYQMQKSMDLRSSILKDAKKWSRCKTRQKEVSNILCCEQRKYIRYTMSETEHDYQNYKTRSLYKNVNILKNY